MGILFIIYYINDNKNKFIWIIFYYFNIFINNVNHRIF